MIEQCGTLSLCQVRSRRLFPERPSNDPDVTVGSHCFTSPSRVMTRLPLLGRPYSEGTIKPLPYVVILLLRLSHPHNLQD
jgi:hypothetical protein